MIFSVKYPIPTGDFVESTNVECKKDSVYKFVYTKKEGGNPVTIGGNDPFKVHCATTGKFQRNFR